MTETELGERIEAALDTTTLADFLSEVSDICYLKADHIELNWQDDGLAKVWRRMSRRLGTQARAAAQYRI